MILIDTAKYIRKLILPCGLLLIGLTGCSDSGNLQPEPEDNPYIPKEDYYIQLNVVASQEGSTTRSETTPEGTSSDEEVDGTNNESVLKSASIYFCEDNNVMLSFATASFIAEEDKDNYTLYARIPDLKLLTDLAGKTLSLIIVGNVAETPFSHDLDNTKNISTAKFSISGANAKPLGDFGDAGQILPLVSADNFFVRIPGDPETDTPETILEEVKKLFDKKTPTNAWWCVQDNDGATSIKLERGVARIEYRGRIDAEAETLEETEGSHIFNIGNLDVKVKLYSLTPFNINNEAYLFRHTLLGTTGNAFGIPENELKVFGKERGNISSSYNWVASTWWKNSQKKPTLHNKISIEDYMYQVADNGAGTILLTDLLDRTPSEVLKKEGTKITGGYHPWRYVSENTLYSTGIMDDEEVLDYATGVVFTFKVLDSENIEIKHDTHSDGHDFPKEVQWSKEAGKENHLNIINPTTLEWIDIEPGEEECYYIKLMACIVHNAPSDAIGPMYYGVVRNNSYQMSIRSLNGLPNPRDPKSLYLDLDVKVKNWQQRENNYDF